ncbi:hypothetical protein QL285_009031 [Trifolium repens]|nr:hypothetical protein QL285_009031 [Trifolium repens]
MPMVMRVVIPLTLLSDDLDYNPRREHGCGMVLVLNHYGNKVQLKELIETRILDTPSLNHLRFSLRFDIGFLGVRLRNEVCRLLRRWRLTAELCSKFCYGIKTISVFRQVSESSLFPFMRRLQVDRLSGARTRRETDSWSYAWIVRPEDFSFLLAFNIICVSESYSFRCVV